mgnify:CR=1 FL=1
MDNYLKTFLLHLQDNEFKPDETKTRWTGSVFVEWKDAETGDLQGAKHTIAICLLKGFPYRAPVIYAIDEPTLTTSWHLNPDTPPSLCLWDSERGWQPDFTAHKLLNRAHDWFYHYHTNSWPPNSQLPDLHLYLDPIGIVAIGDEWPPTSEAFSGTFRLWRPKYKNTPYLASCHENKTEPEPRLAETMVLGANLPQIRGVWFRVPQPFVPPNRLDNLLQQIDAVAKAPPGKSYKNCVASVSRKTTDGFPIAIGYPDNQGEERWLFLWGQPPKRKQKRFLWSSVPGISQVEIKSFQTAPAGKEALLKRTAYVSKSLTNCRIILFGVGSLGSSIALLLAKAGVSALRLIDNDHLMPVNVMRHVCGLNHVGATKTKALKSVIRQHNPDCLTDFLPSAWDREQLRDYMSGYDLVIDATGNTNFSRYLNGICVELNQPVLFTATYRKARIGRIVMRLNSDAPCLECYLAHPEEWAETDYPTIPLNPNEGFIEDGCGSVTEEAVALDMEAVANFAARQAIKILNNQHNGANLAMLVNEPLLDADNEIFHTANARFWTNKPHSDCLVCKT